MKTFRNLGTTLCNGRTILVACIILLIGFLVMVFTRDNFLAINADVNAWSISIQNASLTLAATIIHYIFDTPAMVVICLLIVIILFCKNHKYDSYFLAATMLADLVILTAAKLIIQSPRPLNRLIDLKDFSFPSGHVMSATVLFVVLLYLGWKHWKGKQTKIIAPGVLLTLAVIIIGLSRIYLNVHWLSDIVAGFLLGLSLALFSIWVFQRFLRKRQQ